MILDFISSSPYAGKLCFIGGTSLRLVHGIDRFSEDLDFDCKNMTEEEFKAMTDDILAFLRMNDFNVEPRDRLFLMVRYPLFEQWSIIIVRLFIPLTT